ncbi:preprotein translocase subunit SecY [Coxiella endosymbiont of Amblyomma sculptum]|uniref:preprotein translocase subunit SecY n=1 Tax=Coxiella endosymbiont of Amblyomma sculptum TaxID=2487929 RepID=UPI00132EFFDA|nr:preprotein translocase subunit SecY [Coxiella endosymbiont of Amblyomma sculptum]QHG92454.1 preprotein translocase subunit SecY [Coxiella endosymbiont of Amblyomma sculptum]
MHAIANRRKFGGIPSSLSQGGFGELRKRLLFVLIGIFVYRLGTYIPIPGLNPSRLSKLFHQHEWGFLGMFNMFSGGALSRMTIFALGIMPYISSSIIVQMYSQISPKMQVLQKEGESGHRKINQYIRYGTVVLALLQSIFMTKWLVNSSGVVIDPNFGFYFTTVVTLVTGTMFLMWLGEQMTERGIGNGISLIIFSSIASRLPSAISQVFMQVRQDQMSVLTLLFLLSVIILVILVVVFFERAQRRITINYAKRQQGRKLYTAQSSHLPLKINMSGVIPVIFAQSIILFPGAVAKFMASIRELGWLDNISLALSNGQPAYIVIFAIAVVFFSFFYTMLVFNPRETAENLKKSGAFISGIRPGEQTANYIGKVMMRLTLIGSVYLASVALLPQFLILVWNVPFYFGGTSLLIAVVVIMDFVAQIQAHVVSHQYESLMKKSGIKGSRFGLIR